MNVPNPNYREFSDADYTRLRKSLIGRRAGTPARQREFLRRVLHGRDFVAFMEQEVGIVGDDDLDPLADRMSEAEFLDPPADTERRLFDAWGDLKPRTACRTPFWGYMTWRHIREGRIESCFLAANGGSQAGGAARIEKVLAVSADEAPKQLDDCVRAVLRRLGGLPEARGNRTVYVNCPLSRSWWRERFVREASGDDSETAERVGQVVRISQQYWEQLVLFVVSRNSVFGSPPIRAALVKSVGEHIAGNPRSPVRRADVFLRAACRTLSTVQASRELSVMPLHDAEAIVRDVVAMHVNVLNDSNEENGADI